MTRPISARLATGAWRSAMAVLLAAGMLLAPGWAAAVTLRWAAQSDVMTLVAKRSHIALLGQL